MLVVAWAAGVIFVAGGLACGQRPLLFGNGGQRVSGAGGTAPIGVGGLGGADGQRDAAADLRVRDAASSADGPHLYDSSTSDEPSGDAAPGADVANDARNDVNADLVGDGEPDAAGAKPRTLSLVLAGAPWYASEYTAGMAVDDLNRVYVGDYANVWVVDGTSVSAYLTAAEAAGPMGTQSELGDFDIGPDDRLYIVMSAFFVGTGKFTSIVRSSMAHQTESWADLSQITQPRKVAVIADGYLATVSQDGFWTVTAGGDQLVYASGKLIYPFGCATEDLSAAPSGVFLYQSGCNGYPLLRGNADGTGTGIGVLYSTTTLMPPSAVNADNFLCSARDPSGGFYIVVEDSGDEAPRLYHVAEDAQGAGGLAWIPTVPSFAQAKNSQNETFGFDYCSIATARDGTVFFQTYHQLWKVSP